jgi:molecular chaperone DnaK (HSP70)
VAIVDFGHGALTNGGYKFSAKVVTQKGRNPKPVPKIEELGYVWDDKIGGIDLDVAFARYLSQKFQTPVTNILIEDAQRIKHALTLTDTANVSMDSIDQKVVLSRDEFQTSCKTIWDRVESLARSLNQTFDSVEFVGGASRIPYFQDFVSQILGPASRSLNSDESVATGAAYTAAIASGAFRLMDVHHEATSSHAANLSYGQKEVRLFVEGSALDKLKTARFDASNATDLSLKYVSKVPVGCDCLIYQWEIVQREPFPPVSRVVLSVGFNKLSLIELSKSVLFSKNEKEEVSQIPIDVRRSYKPMKILKSEKLEYRRLLSAFAADDFRMSKIAEARNTLESLVFELKDALSRDAVWLKVTSEDEKREVQEQLTRVSQWLEEHHEFEDDSELKNETRVLEQSVKAIRYRVHESRTRESSIQELEYLLNEMQDSVLNRWPAKKLHVPKQQKKAILNHVKTTREWLERKMEDQAELEPWDDPVLKTSELELRIKKLGDSFRALEEGVLSNKLKNRRDDDDDEDLFGADI